MASGQNKYATLISNTIIFALGTFGSKLLVFLLMPLYTSYLSTAEYGAMDVVVNVSNMLLPLVIVSINDGVIRFGMDRAYHRQDVFSTGIWVSLAGFGVFLLFCPLLSRIEMISDYTALIYIYVFAAALQGVSAQFVRAMGLVRLFAFNGILNTVSTVVCNVLFLVVMGWGMYGYILSVVVSNFVSMAFLWVTARLYRYMKSFRRLPRGTVREMIVYSLPLIPATIMWSITNVSDRFFVTYYLGEAQNGIYSVAYKLPTIISVISAIFTQAWQLSAIGERESEDREQFYSNIFQSYQTIVFLAAGGILLLIKPLMHILVTDEFFEAWQYTPLLVVSVVFSCFSSYFASIYMASKKNIMAMVTIFVGAVLNIILNYLWIPVYGLNGAAGATAVCYILIFLLRAIDTRRLVFLDLDWKKLVLNSLLLGIQCWLVLGNGKYLYPMEVAVLFAMLLVNLRGILTVADRFYRAFVLHRRAGA